MPFARSNFFRVFARISGLALGAASIALLPRVAHAEQFLLFDAQFTFTWEDAINATPSKSHFYVKESNFLNKARPVNWLTPVNYRAGKVHIRLEVLEKPAGGQMQGWARCYVGNAGSYGCPYTDYYTDVGIYERDVKMDSFYNNATIDWSKGIKEVDLVYTINNSGSGHVHFFPELKDKTTPTKVRIVMVQVSEGGTYDPSILASGGSGTGGAGGGAGSGGASAGSGGAAVAGSSSGGAGGSTMAGGSGGSSVAGAGAAGSPMNPTTGGSAGSLGGAGAAPNLPAANDDRGASCALATTRPGAGSAPSGWWALGLILTGLGLRRRR